MKPHIWTQFKLQYLKSRVIQDIINFCEDYGMDNFKLIPVTTPEILEYTYLNENDCKLLIKIKSNWFERIFFKKETKWEDYGFVLNRSFYEDLKEKLKKFYRHQHKITEFYAGGRKG